MAQGCAALLGCGLVLFLGLVFGAALLGTAEVLGQFCVVGIGVAALAWASVQIVRAVMAYLGTRKG